MGRTLFGTLNLELNDVRPTLSFVSYYVSICPLSRMHFFYLGRYVLVPDEIFHSRVKVDILSAYVRVKKLRIIVRHGFAEFFVSLLLRSKLIALRLVLNLFQTQFVPSQLDNFLSIINLYRNDKTTLIPHLKSFLSYNIYVVQNNTRKKTVKVESNPD